MGVLLKFQVADHEPKYYRKEHFGLTLASNHRDGSSGWFEVEFILALYGNTAHSSFSCVNTESEFNLLHDEITYKVNAWYEIVFLCKF